MRDLLWFGEGEIAEKVCIIFVRKEEREIK